MPVVVTAGTDPPLANALVNTPVDPLMGVFAIEPPVMFTAFAFWFAIVPAGDPFTPDTVGLG
ncbi:hypothetical protein WJ17_03805 [Burkholderia vietnamiensis]|nr:hypothetical protein WJ17_03805 [Burkholderia vietnamiensis]